MGKRRPTYFSDLMPTLAERSHLAAISQLGFANIPLRHRLSELFKQSFGNPGAFLADPTFESVFGWKASDKCMADLADDLLTPELVSAMDSSGEYRFGRQIFPYTHQRISWEILSRDDPQSLVVTSGTGSGKTECFMVPILDHMQRLSQQYGRLIGVRALFLYPLNALINNQRNRLRAWTEPFDNHIRFCLYNGNTPERPAPAFQERNHPSEVLDRKTLRDIPPPILVTNSTMLEYMLVRTQDEPILEQSRGKLQWVVLDEAHTYVGSQAAEVALLLRRVLNAFGVRPQDVRFVATSATIGDPEGEAGESLKRFLAEVAGVAIDRVHLVAGERQVPPLPNCNIRKQPLETLEQIDVGEEVSPHRYAALCAHPTAKAIRDLFTRRQGTSVARLSELCGMLYGQGKNYSQSQQMQALRWLDLLTGTRPLADTDTPSEAFLPLRAHLFHQTLSGIWACADQACTLKKDSALDDKSWPFGALYLEPWKHCGCGSPVYELASCGDCGAVYLMAGEARGHLLHLQSPHLLDDFELDFEENLDDEAEDDEEPHFQPNQRRVLIVNRSMQSVGGLYITKKDRKIAERSDETLKLLAQEDDGSGLTCPGCGAEESPRKWLFRHGRLSAPFLLGNILPTLLEYAPDGEKPLDHPYRGRRLLSFTDSRQGTARMAAKLQQDAERNRVRGLVYHLTLQHAGSNDSAQKNKLIQEISVLKQALKATPNSTLEDMISDKETMLASLDRPQPVLSNDLAGALSRQDRDMQFMRETYRRYAPDIFAHDTGDLTLAKMFLVREFGRRPKRANNLETMGLVALYYPTLDDITDVPQVVGDVVGFDLKTWRDFLKICLDFFVRSGGSLDFPREWKNWLGMRFGQTWLVPHDQEDVGRGMRRWPSVKRGKSNSLLVRLLAYVLRADLDTATGEDQVDMVLRAAWDALRSKGLLRQGADGWRLPLDKMAFSSVNKGFVCPVTRRFLDTTLKGVTPYLPKTANKSTAVCQEIDIPLYPKAFGGVADDQERIRLAREWLTATPEITELRDQGLWSVVNDRVIELAPFFKTAEHSAQQAANRLQKYEHAFQVGDINLLSCSTTMEMGIDIGGISLVAMNNVPPHPSSYLQRAGRAGRRQESRSLVMTLCKSNPHDQSVFGNSRWAFDTLLPAPKVSLDSPVIVQRHVQAMLLTHFLRRRLKKGNQEQLKLNCGAFFMGESTPLASGFSTWCRRLSTTRTDGQAEGLRHLLRHTLYERASLDTLFNRAADEMDALAKAWRTEWENLQREQQQIEKEPGDNSPASRAVRFHMARLEEEYLLRELANRGFLPAYGFPSHITPFDNYTVDQFKRDQRAREAGREDNRSRFREMPSRDLATALREYAPGSSIVMDGLVYRSAGLTLNWHIPADQEDVREVQNIKFAWRCSGCGSSGTTHQLHVDSHCPACGAVIKSGYIREFIEPGGFAVDFYETPTNDIDTQHFVPVEQPWISVEGDWVALPNPDLGRFRVTTKGHIFHQSRGVFGSGYALCLECGRAEPMVREGGLPDRFSKPHRKLRRSKDEAPFCPGSHDPWKIKQGITLGHEAWTDICELQLKTTDGVWLDDEMAATTLAVALRDTLAELIGVQSTELACATKPVRTEEGTRCQSIVLFDRNAAGYASSAGRYLDKLFHKTRQCLNCPAACDSVCPHCVLDFDQRFAAENMDRHRALDVLTQQWVDGLRLPATYSFFGEHSVPVFTSLIEELWQATSLNTVVELRFYTGGDPDLWDIGISPLRKLVYQMAASGRQVRIIVPAKVLQELDETDRYLLASLAEAPHVHIHSEETSARCGEGWLIAEALGQGIHRWAIDDEHGLHFSPGWGRTENVLVTTTKDSHTSLDSKEMCAEQLRPSPIVQGDREIELRCELNGSLQGFGKRFWDYLIAEHEPIAKCLQSADDNITMLRYQDRYLFSPLSVRILFEIVRALKLRMGDARWAATALDIETLKCRPQTAYHARPSNRMWHDWDNSDTREGVIQAMFDAISVGSTIRLNLLHQAPHARVLELEFASGTRLSVRFDQGITYWRIAHATPYRNKIFDFTETNPWQQARHLRKAAVSIEDGNFPTQLFLMVNEGDSQ